SLERRSALAAARRSRARATSRAWRSVWTPSDEPSAPSRRRAMAARSAPRLGDEDDEVRALAEGARALEGVGLDGARRRLLARGVGDAHADAGGDLDERDHRIARRAG